MPSVSNTPDTLTGVTEVIAAISNITGLAPDQDMYEAGVTSVMALPLLLELEDRFQVSIPDDLFIAARSPRTIAGMIATLQGR